MKWLLLVAVSLAMPAMAVPRLESVTVKPNPVPFKGEQTPEAVISVTIERPTPLDQVCEASVDPGDGSKAKHMNWEIGDRRTRTTRHEYKKPGTYKIVVTGSGKDACAGRREATVTVGGSAPAAKPDAAPAAQCPKGWTVAKGATADRFTCERNK